jgi:RNA polymerase sigma-32 factor
MTLPPADVIRPTDTESAEDAGASTDLDPTGTAVAADAEASESTGDAMEEGGSFDEDGEDDDAAAEGPKLPALSRATTAAAKNDLLSYYLAEVRRYPLLEPEEERTLAIKYQDTGDTEAAHALVTANLRLVVKLAFQYHRQWSNVLDLIQEGNVGLVEALNRYDPYRGIRFSSYAQYWIRAMILRFLMDNYRLVRLGSTRHGRKLFFQLQKEKERLIRDGVHPSTLALSEALEVPEKEVVIVDRHLSAPALSLHAPTGAGDEGRALAEVVGDSDQHTPEDQVERGELGAMVQQQLAAFAETLRDDRERSIWTRRLTAQEPESLASLGTEYGVSKERIRQVEARIKRRLRDHLTRELGDEIAFDFDVPDKD